MYERTPATARTQLDEALGMASWAAGHLLGAGAALMDDELDLIEQAIYEFVALKARDILGEWAYATALAQGRAMTAEQTYAYIVTDAEEREGDGPGPGVPFDGASPPAYLIGPPA